MYNQKCVRKTATDPSPTMCAGYYKLNYTDKQMNYVCECGGINYYYKDEATPATYVALGKETDLMGCQNEVLDVDIVNNKCYKGKQELIFDPVRYWCGGIPLAIHNFDIIKWDWGTAGTTTNNRLIDFFSNTCKVKFEQIFFNNF